MEIKQIRKYNKTIHNSINHLLPYLSRSIRLPSKRYLKKVLRSKNTYLFVGIVNKNIIGTFTLIKYDLIVGSRFWIEDVVVNKQYRGCGYGKELIQFAIDFAKSLGATSINLTSNPKRKEANNLYSKLGFIKYETNVYRYML